MPIACCAVYCRGTHKFLTFTIGPDCPILFPFKGTSSNVSKLQPGDAGFCTGFVTCSRNICSGWHWVSFMKSYQEHPGRQRKVFYTLNSSFPMGNEVEREAWIMAIPSPVQLTRFSSCLTPWYLLTMQWSPANLGPLPPQGKSQIMMMKIPDNDDTIVIN